MKIVKSIGVFEIIILVLSVIPFSLMFAVFESESVSAISIEDFQAMLPTTKENEQCCVSAVDGSSCQAFPTSSCNAKCNGNCVATSCELISECQPGCCIDKEDGTCSPMSMKGDCEARGGEWKQDALCNLGECQKGCCTIGLNSEWLTRGECEKQSRLRGIPFDYNSAISNQLECIKENTQNEVGACVFEIGDENHCRFTSEINCLQSINGEFYKDYLCSNEELNTICEKQASVNCVDGREEIYWFDSCGNRENIYSSNKVQSWNSGKVLTKSASCNVNSANIDSASCGNCDYNLGSVCAPYDSSIDSRKIQDGDFVCRNLNCRNAPARVDWKGNVLSRKDRINGESWCVYDGPIGGVDFLPTPSLDLIGSRHWKYVCDNGQVRVEGCGDYRKEICVEKTVDQKSQATCRVNLWEQCLSYNGGAGGMMGGFMGMDVDCGPDCIAKCTKNPDCRVHPILIGEYKNSVCVPKYPPGLDLGENMGMNNIFSSFSQQALGNLGGLGGMAGGIMEGGQGSVCDIGTKSCTSVWVKKCLPTPHWECIKNCACHSELFTVQMNNLCASVGDCGVYANLAGRPALMGGRIKKEGNHGRTPIQPMILGIAYMGLSLIPPATPATGGIFNENSQILELGEGNLRGLIDPFMGSLGGFGGDGGFELQDGPGWGTIAGIGAIGGTAGAVGGLIALPGSVSMLFGGPGLITNIGSLGFTPFSAVLGPALIGAAILIGLTFALGCGKMEQVEITYTCSPSGGIIGGNCADCGSQDSLKPCTKYRCESLGSRCKLINENTGFDECVAIEGESSIPTITPWNEILNSSLYKYEDVSNNGFRIRQADGECIRAFTPMVFGIQTDIHAVCRWEVEATGFANMSNSFLEGSVYSKNHTMVTSLPSVESLIYSELGLNDGTQEYQTAYNEMREHLLNAVGDLDIYVKCVNLDLQENSHNYKINMCVRPGPDLTPPVIEYTAPPMNSIIRMNAEEQEVVMYVREPAECRWDVVNPGRSDLNAYNSLKNEMECQTDVSEGSLLGWSCNATLPISADENKFYFLCRDQPWLSEGVGPDGELRNIGASPIDGGVFEYVLNRTKTELSIDSIKPSGTVTRGAEPATIELELETKGGAYNGLASCAFSFEKESESYILFPYVSAIKLDTKHKQTFTQMTRGEHKIYFRCADDAGNIAEGEANFKLELDTTPPVVTRVFGSGSEISVMINEEGYCYYNKDSRIGCGFSLNNASEMRKQGLRNSFSGVLGIDYYVRCRDIWGNQPDACSIVVRLNELE